MLILLCSEGDNLDIKVFNIIVKFYAKFTVIRFCHNWTPHFKKVFVIMYIPVIWNN